MSDANTHPDKPAENTPTGNTPSENIEGAAVFEARAQAVLRDSISHLDGRTLSRLTQARHAALAATKPSRLDLFGWKLLAPLSATAAAVLAIMLLPNQAQHSSQPTLLAEDMPDRIEILAAEDSLEFYRDVEFYAWLDGELSDDASTDHSLTIGSHGDQPATEA